MVYHLPKPIARRYGLFLYPLFEDEDAILWVGNTPIKTNYTAFSNAWYIVTTALPPLRKVCYWYVDAFTNHAVQWDIKGGMTALMWESVP